MVSIHDAIEANNQKAVKDLIKADAYCVHVLDGQGNTPLHVAASTGRSNLVRLLVRHGSDVNARGDMKRTPLHYAAKEGELEVVRILAKAGADLNAVDAYQFTPLLYSVQGTYYDDDKPVAEALLRCSAVMDLNSAVWMLGPDELRTKLAAEGISGATLPDRLIPDAVFRNDREIIDLLLEHGANINAIDGDNALFVALSGFDSILPLLLERGADVNARDSSGKSVLQYAKENKCGKVAIKLLTKYGAK